MITKKKIFEHPRIDEEIKYLFRNKHNLEGEIHEEIYEYEMRYTK